MRREKNFGPVAGCPVPKPVREKRGALGTGRMLKLQTLTYPPASFVAGRWGCRGHRAHRPGLPSRSVSVVGNISSVRGAKGSKLDSSHPFCPLVSYMRT